MEKKLLLFAGTTEGRALAEYLDAEGISCDVCVATAYGKELIDASTTRHRVHTGRLDDQGMRSLMQTLQITDVLDATHPYAVLVSDNIRQAAREAGCTYHRILRAQSEAEDAAADWVRVDSVQEAVDYLKGQEGAILAATGSKELHLYTQIPGYQDRVFARVLSTTDSMQIAADCGFQGKNLICMQGPFGEELNTAMLRATGAAFLVTKQSGKTGGFPEKVRAAKAAGARLVVVGRPGPEEGVSLEEMKGLLTAWKLPKSTPGVMAEDPKTKVTEKIRQVFVVGIGMGSPEGMTRQAWEACRQADVLIGAGRMLESAASLDKPFYTAYLAEEICSFIDTHPAYEKIAILLSGDVGFYSGAKKLLDLLEAQPSLKVQIINGISSVVYLCGKLGTAWEDVHLMSLHGRNQNLVAAVGTHRKVFAIVGKEAQFQAMCRQLTAYGFGEVQVAAGCAMSYPQERILRGTPQTLQNAQVGDLTAVLITNPNAVEQTTHGLPDEVFVRGKVPMTKEEIRCVSLAKLRLERQSVIYDVGAGTGSVSIEMALRATDGWVYAVEKKEEAAVLIEENARALGACNLQVIRGLAPEALKELPAPTHAFIGGSSGNLQQIVSLLLAKNPGVRIVINAIALETVGEALNCIKNLPVTDVDVVSLSVGKARAVASYHMMMGTNPVYVISFTGGGEAAV